VQNRRRIPVRKVRLSAGFRDGWSGVPGRWATAVSWVTQETKNAETVESKNQVQGKFPAPLPRQFCMTIFKTILKWRSRLPICSLSPMSGKTGVTPCPKTITSSRSGISSTMCDPTFPPSTHLDYSARLQTVHRETNPRFWALLNAFKDKTGYGVMINTSFNVRENRLSAHRMTLQMLHENGDGLPCDGQFCFQQDRTAAMARKTGLAGKSMDWIKTKKSSRSSCSICC